MDAYQFMRENKNYFEDFVTRSTYHSNAIEGNTLSYAETYAILWNDNSLQIHATARELYEAINHKYAMSLALDNDELELKETLIKQVAQAINKNINEVSGYRKVQVLIMGAEHIPPAPALVVQNMMELVYFYNKDLATKQDPFEREAAFHISFERIHPFEDGNGRTGRILINRGLMKSGLAPAVITKDVRARYLETIATQNTVALAELLRSLSAQEEERMKVFAQVH